MFRCGLCENLLCFFGSFKCRKGRTGASGEAPPVGTSPFSQTREVHQAAASDINTTLKHVFSTRSSLQPCSIPSRHQQACQRHCNIPSRHQKACQRHCSISSRHQQACQRHCSIPSRHQKACHRHYSISSRHQKACQRHCSIPSRHQMPSQPTATSRPSVGRDPVWDKR